MIVESAVRHEAIATRARATFQGYSIVVACRPNLGGGGHGTWQFNGFAAGRHDAGNLSASQVSCIVEARHSLYGCARISVVQECECSRKLQTTTMATGLAAVVFVCSSPLVI